MTNRLVFGDPNNRTRILDGELVHIDDEIKRLQAKIERLRSRRAKVFRARQPLTYSPPNSK